MKKVGAIAVFLALVLAGAAVVLLPGVMKKRAVLNTLKTAAEAYEARDFDGLMGTIDPAAAAKVNAALESADDVIDKGTDLINQLIGGWNALVNANGGGEQYQINELEKKKLDRDAVLDLIASTASPLKNANFTADSLKLQDVSVLEDRGEVSFTCTAEIDGSPVTNHLHIGLRYSEPDKKWYIVSCSDEQGWLDGLRLVLNWQ